MTSATGLRIRKIAAENGALGGLVVLVVVLSIVAPTFLSAQNLLNVGVQSAVVAVLALGFTFVIVSGGIDLSVGSVAALSAMVGAWSSAEAGLPGLIALLLGLATGVVAGLVNGALVSYGRLPAFIATLAMLSVARGLTPGGVPGHPADHSGRDQLSRLQPRPVPAGTAADHAGIRRSHRAGTGPHVLRPARCTPSVATPRPPGCPASTCVGSSC